MKEEMQSKILFHVSTALYLPYMRMFTPYFLLSSKPESLELASIKSMTACIAVQILPRRIPHVLENPQGHTKKEAQTNNSL
jgi:hypothetical protein